jgi:hypothetical protein
MQISNLYLPRKDWKYMVLSRICQESRQSEYAKNISLRFWIKTFDYPFL